MKREDALKLFGFTKFESKCLLYMLKHKDAKAREIEKATGMRQPEVSMGLQGLTKKGFVSFEKITDGKKKGRPRHLYHLKISGDKFKEYLINQAEKKKQEIDKALKIVLRNMGCKDERGTPRKN